jgi:ribonuclease Z
MLANLVVIAAMLMGTALIPVNAIAQDTFRLTLVGTGTPTPDPQRLGPATMVEVGNQTFLFDAGRGLPVRFSQLRKSMAKIDVLFITHFHSDHVSGIPDLWLTSWLPAGGQRVQPFRVIGPTGAKELMTHLEKAYAADVRIRIADQKLAPAGATVLTEEFAADGVVYERDGVQVRAFEVNHGDEIKPAYGYRIDYKGRSVLISGDTRYSENLIRNGMGVDLLVHAIAGSKPELLQNIIVRRILDHHTLPPEAAMVFNKTKPKLAAYTHFVLQRTETVAAPTVEEIMAETRKTYSGPLQAGEDLMSFEITEAGVKVNAPPR